MTVIAPNQHPDLTENIFLELIKINVPLEEHDAFHSGYCTFCYDEEESFLVYPHKKTWHCYACQRAGNVYEFIEKTQKITARDTIEFIDLFIKNSMKDTHKNLKKSKQKKEKAKEKSKIKGKNKSVVSSHLEKQETTQDIIENRTDDDLSLEHLLEKFHHYEGCQGMAIIANDKLIHSSLSHFIAQDIHLLNNFIKDAFEQTKKVLGNFDTKTSEQIFRMELILNGRDMKLIWLPMLSDGKYNILLLLESKMLETLLLLKLKKAFNSLA